MTKIKTRISEAAIERHASNLKKSHVAILKASLGNNLYRDIQADLGIKSRGTVKSRLHRARAAITELMVADHG